MRKYIPDDEDDSEFGSLAKPLCIVSVWKREQGDYANNDVNGN